MKSEKLRTVILDYIIIFFGAIIYALSVNVFISPNNIAPGGLTGIAIILNYLFSFPIGLTVLILNIPLFIWGRIENGKNFMLKTIIATTLVSFMIDTLAFLPYHYQGETVLASLFGGLISGVGLAVIFYRGATTGGTDIIGRIAHKHYPYISIGTVILMIDIVIIIAASIVYRSIESGLFAVIAIFVETKVIDAFIYGMAHDNGKLLFIITSASDEVTNLILKRIGRGVTMLDARGAYSKVEKEVLLCAVRPSQVHKVKSLITSVDENAFVIVTTATAINGNGFYSNPIT